MSSDLTPEEHVNRPEKTGPREESSEADASGSSFEAQTRNEAAPERFNPLLVSFLTLFLITFGVWLVTGGERYREEYAEATEGWRVGTSHTVELTLVAKDKLNLACASRHVVAGLRCGYGADGEKVPNLSTDGPDTLQPYNTVGGELLLGAGLWKSRDLKGSLPGNRFSVVCKYHIKGLIRSARIRFDQNGAFNSPGKTMTVGTLTDCAPPQ